MTPVQKTVTRTVVVLIGMFFFAFALVPLYDVFCRVTGLNGKAANQPQAMSNEEADTSRYVTVQFITRSSKGLPWELEALTRQVRVHPGQPTEVEFAFTNNSDDDVWGRAVPSVTPSEASLHMRKLTCFCFQEQLIEGGERIEMPLVFQLTRDLPEDINTVTLVYTLYPVDNDNVSQQVQTTSLEGGDA